MWVVSDAAPWESLLGGPVDHGPLGLPGPDLRPSGAPLSGARLGVVVAGQIALRAAALLDLHPRTDSELNGSLGTWMVLSFLDFAGPIAYFAIGRRHASSS